MKILALEVELPDTVVEQFQPYLAPEAEAIWKLQQEGIIREVYFRGDRHTSVLVLECQDIHQARAALSVLPLVQNKLITFDVFALLPYDGFSRLFSSGR